MFHKTKTEFEGHKHCLEATQIESEIKQLEKNKTDVDSLRENHKELINHKKLKKVILFSK